MNEARAHQMLAERRGDNCPAGQHFFETRGDRRACVACDYSVTADDITQLLVAASVVAKGQAS